MKRVFERFCRGLKEVRRYQISKYSPKYRILSFLKEDTMVTSRMGLFFLGIMALLGGGTSGQCLKKWMVFFCH